MGEPSAPMGCHEDDIGPAPFSRRGDRRTRLAHHDRDVLARDYMKVLSQVCNPRANPSIEGTRERIA